MGRNKNPFTNGRLMADSRHEGKPNKGVMKMPSCQSFCLYVCHFAIIGQTEVLNCQSGCQSVGLGDRHEGKMTNMKAKLPSCWYVCL